MIDKNIYSAPVCQLILFDDQDVVRTSGDPTPPAQPPETEKGFGDIFGGMM